MKIKELTLYTAQLQEQKGFYSQTLGFSVLSSEDDSFRIKAGETIVEFRDDPDATPYHFAFNIPSNLVQEALEWLKNKVEILKFHDRELVDFKAWKAEAMYFYDKDRNIVEFIGRRDLPPATGKNSFSANQIMEVSEIGVACNDIKKIYRSLPGLEIYDGDLEQFCAIGDPHGLFIVIDKNRKKWMPCDDLAFSSPFQLIAETPLGLKEVIFSNEEMILKET